ncbi:MAG TPA: hypothetical protein VE620_10595 [Myxococcales bacterium]|jgi:hypothetical protein|nr:hypothetical protein [Myxococcales bacterium]
MKRGMIWTLLALALAAPAVWAGAAAAAGCCPFAACCDAGCEGCPFGS